MSVARRATIAAVVFLRTLAAAPCVLGVFLMVGALSIAVAAQAPQQARIIAVDRVKDNLYVLGVEAAIPWCSSPPQVSWSWTR